MNEGTIVAWILIPTFLAVGVYLIWYSRRRKKLVESFADLHQLPMCPERKAQIQVALDTSFVLKDGLVRTFGQLSSLVDGFGIWMFRTVELLDLDPHAQSHSTHFNRIAALFEISADHGEFFLLDAAGQPHRKLPGRNQPNAAVVKTVRLISQACSVRHALSVTLSRGHGLIYLEPAVVGGETMADVNTLYCVAKKMRAELAEDA